ncbi:MAG: hypothetical protein AAF589_05955 [Planctomycetota bacterium]
MGELIVDIVVENVMHRDMKVESPALVDTGSSFLTLPMAWKEKLGEFEKNEEMTLELADQHTAQGILCGPVRVTIDGFEPVFTEVMFMEMAEREGRYEPLIGCIPLETGRLAVDLDSHTLVSLKRARVK